MCTGEGGSDVLVSSRKLTKLCKETLVDLVLWLTLLSDSDEKVCKRSTTSRPCSLKQYKVGLTKSQATVSHEDCDGTCSICVFFLYTPIKMKFI